MADLLREHPGLRPFLLSNVRLTGTRIGAGAYGSVEEVEILGAVCAVKKIHDIFQDRSEIPAADIQSATTQFVEECQLMSTLRHPHIVQFLGVCFLPGSRLPALVMELLLTSLHDLLDTGSELPLDAPKPFFPLGLKRSILHDVARGLAYLHDCSPPIIHRDLSAKNVLLNTAMVAKIADLGVARILPRTARVRAAATMTKAPGAFIYMPPEALEAKSENEEDSSKYDASIDIFSFGVVAIFTLSQTFPCNLLAPNYREKRKLIGRTELERRDQYMQKIYSQLKKGHPLIKMIKKCLDFPEKRPGIREVLRLLEQARAEIKDEESDMNKLELVRALQSSVRENSELQQQLSRKEAELTRAEETIRREELRQQEAAKELEDKNPSLSDSLGEGVDEKDLEASVEASADSGTETKHAVGGKATLFRGMKGLEGIGSKLKKKKKDPDSYLRAEFPGNQSVNEEEEGEAPDSDEDLPEIPVEDEEWYYGDIDRRLAKSKCKNPGDYLVRYSARAQNYVLTCNNNGAVQHFMIQQINGEDGNPKYRFESKTFSRIASLLKNYVKNGMAVTKPSGAILIRAISKYDKWSLRHNDVKVGRKIGEGTFGQVFEALLSSTGQRVAVKTYMYRSNERQDMDKFLQEAEILKQCSHPNIVCLIGVCAEKEPVYIVMELMLGGALLEYLRKKGGHQPQHKLCTMAIDACAGMEYLEKNNCIHRNLAARNCLVGENDTVKIAGFSMSREGIYTETGARNFPIKWTAPESINYGKFTSASDVWSYGILLWEVFSFGSVPYPSMKFQEARSQVEMGYRMGPPADCPSGVHAAMSQCWQYEPEERPNFSQILDMLRKVQEDIQ